MIIIPNEILKEDFVKENANGFDGVVYGDNSELGLIELGLFPSLKNYKLIELTEYKPKDSTT